MEVGRDSVKYGIDYRWLYRGEGNRCLVVADSHKQIVYRLVKQPCKQITAFVQQNLFNDGAERIYSQLKDMGDYMNNVFSCLISQHFVTKPNLIELSPESIAHIMGSIQPCRPDKRRTRGLDPDCRSALTMPDLCFVRGVLASPYTTTLSIEIKPKRGILPLSPTSNNPVLRAPCRFCMHQALKMKQKMWPSKSRYCPIDLFSGHPIRMKRALLGLLETPQNNLKICMNGVEIYPCYSMSKLNSYLVKFFNNDDAQSNAKQGNLNHLLELVVKALLWSPSDWSDHNHRHEPQHTQFCDVTTALIDNEKNDDRGSGLPGGCVLERISYVQKIDTLGIQGVYPLYQRLITHLQHTPDDRYQWKVDGPYTHDWWSFFPTNSDPSSIDYAVHKIKTFLMCTTASDCSVMIAIQPEFNHCMARNVIKDDQGRKFSCSIGIIDLDPKPFDKIPTHFKRHTKIIENYEDCVVR